MKKTTFGMLLKAWRISNGYTTLQAAMEVDINPTSYNDMERGRSYPSAKTMAKIMKNTSILPNEITDAIMSDFQ